LQFRAGFYEPDWVTCPIWAQLWVPAITIARPKEVCAAATVRRQPF
jgi:hypothetical protein